MSTRVVAGSMPAGKPHPAAKWGLLIALLVVVLLGIPKIASAGQPQVQAPTGPKSGGVFTGTFTFVTYIYCTSGPTYTSSYSSSLEGTNTFTFYGAPDGSLFLSINGGGHFLLNSCGDPLTGAQVVAASYTVTKNASGPPPTPSPTPSPTPTPTPPPSGVGGGGGGGSHGSSGGSGAATKSASGSSSGTVPGAGPAQSSEPPVGAAPSVAAAPATSSGEASAAPAEKAAGAVISSTGTLAPGLGLATIPIGHATMNSARTAFALVVLMGIGLSWWRRRHPRDPVVPTRGDRLTIKLEPYVFKLRIALKRLAKLFTRRIFVHHKDLVKRRGFSPHTHSGKLTAHHHTSYASLAFLLLLSGVLTVSATISTFAASSSSLLSLTVQGAPPATAATIDQPVDGQHFSVSSVTVRGTCPTGVFVEIWRNGAFAGSTICDLTGLYSVLITLQPGQNDLIARVADALGQYGPDSTEVTVFYDVPPPPTPTPTPTSSPSSSPTSPATPAPTPSSTITKHRNPAPTPAPPPLTITSSKHYYQGAGPGTAVDWELNVSGGSSPYQITWDWGDGTHDTSTSASPGAITNRHSYDAPGIFEVTVRVKDARGAEVVIQLVTIINGPTGAAPIRSKPDPGNLIFIWPLLVIAVLLTSSFWLGERHKLAIAGPRLAT